MKKKKKEAAEKIHSQHTVQEGKTAGEINSLTEQRNQKENQEFKR